MLGPSRPTWKTMVTRKRIYTTKYCLKILPTYPLEQIQQNKQIRLRLMPIVWSDDLQQSLYRPPQPWSDTLKIRDRLIFFDRTDPAPRVWRTANKLSLGGALEVNHDTHGSPSTRGFDRMWSIRSFSEARSMMEPAFKKVFIDPFESKSS